MKSRLAGGGGQNLDATMLVRLLVRESRFENPCVGGSIPPRATKNIVQ
jgi:hypothetical protein